MQESDEPILDKKDMYTKSIDVVSLDEIIRNLLVSQLYGVLCTAGKNHAYGSLLAFSYTQDLKNIVFATPITTRKYKLLLEEKNIAFLVDSRSNTEQSFMSIETITATGKGQIIEKSGQNKSMAIDLVKRHPYLESMMSSESFAVFQMTIFRYFYVTRFQEVQEWSPNKAG